MGGLTLSKEQQVSYTSKEEGYIISRRDWQRIRSQLEKVKVQSPIWSNVGWASVGIGLSCMASWFADRGNIVFLIIGILGIGVAVCSYFASKSETTHYNGALDNLKDTISEIEKEMVPRNDSE